MFATVWAYRTNSGSRGRFVELYGPDGRWAQLFRTHPGYIRTELYEDVSRRGHFMSADLWQSRADYDDFQAAHGDDYDALDRACAGLSEQSHYGFFDDVKDYAPLVFGAAAGEG